MDFPTAIKTVLFEKYLTFSGRASRSEYWYFILFVFICAAVFGAIGADILVGLFELAIFIPSLAVASRRLHDIDRSFWWYLVAFIPLVGIIILIIWMATKGTEGSNRFGSDPLL